MLCLILLILVITVFTVGLSYLIPEDKLSTIVPLFEYIIAPCLAPLIIIVCYKLLSKKDRKEIKNWF